MNYNYHVREVRKPISGKSWHPVPGEVRRMSFCVFLRHFGMEVETKNRAFTDATFSLFVDSVVESTLIRMISRATKMA